MSNYLAVRIALDMHRATTSNAGRMSCSICVNINKFGYCYDVLYVVFIISFLMCFNTRLGFTKGLGDGVLSTKALFCGTKPNLV